MNPDTHGPTKPAFYTVEEIAERLGVSLATIRRAIHDGRLTTYRFGRAVRIAHDDLETFVANARTQTCHDLDPHDSHVHDR